MGKIKGWRKSKAIEDNWVRYKLNNEPNFYNDVSKSHDILIYPIEINSTIKGWKVSSNMFGDKSFLTKLSAIKFAINYMKKNPTPCEVEK